VIKWARALRRRVGNNNVLQIWWHVIGVLLVNHIWTCLSWLIQSSSVPVDPGHEDYGAFEEWQQVSSSLHFPR